MTVTHLEDRTQKGTIEKALSEMCGLYMQKGFQEVTSVMADSEFASLAGLMNNLPGAPKLNLASANEHEPFVERSMQYPSDKGTCAGCSSLPSIQDPT